MYEVIEPLISFIFILFLIEITNRKGTDVEIFIRQYSS